MSEDLIRLALPEEIGRVTSVMTLAFSSDPFMRWMYPDPDAYVRHFPRFVETFAGDAFQHESAMVDESFRAASMWLPPEAEPDEEALAQHVRETVDPEKLPGLGEYFSQMEDCFPKEEIWYLPMLGVDALAQGQGVGARLMNWTLARTDETGISTYLESSNPANIPFYQRLGYEAVGRIQISSDAPLLTPMFRSAR